ncbi:MAG: hypothetical protein KDD70_04100 [Bdellovibrionales bacterium]|nr:hypothetical protein [Bdellovibrionales bacterium]
MNRAAQEIPGLARPQELIHELHFESGELPHTAYCRTDSLGICNPSILSSLQKLGAIISQQIPFEAVFSDTAQRVPNVERDFELQARGRSLYFLQSGDSDVDGKGSIVIRAKGVTHSGGKPSLTPYGGYSPCGMVRSHHMLVVDDGVILNKSMPPAPTGFMLAHKARAVFENTLKLEALGVPVNRVIGYGEFKGIAFQGQALGYVLLAHEKSEGRGPFAQLDLRGDQRRIYQTRPETLTEAASLLRTLHNNRFTHGQPHLGNFSFEGAGRRMIVTDLDTVKEHASGGQAGAEFKFWRALDVLGFMFANSHLTGGMRFSPDFGGDSPIGHAIEHGYFSREEAKEIPASTFEDCRRALLAAFIGQRLTPGAVHREPLESVLKRLAENEILRKVIESADSSPHPAIQDLSLESLLPR